MSARDLLAAATPRPWKLIDDDPESCPYIETNEDDPLATIWDIEPPANAALIVAAVNEYEALLDIERAAKGVRRARTPYMKVADAEVYYERLFNALARLDAIRAPELSPDNSKAAGTPAKSAPTASTEGA